MAETSPEQRMRDKDASPHRDCGCDPEHIFADGVEHGRQESEDRAEAAERKLAELVRRMREWNDRVEPTLDELLDEYEAEP